jgi:calcium/calmodulin-dependent protein kinase I
VKREHYTEKDARDVVLVLVNTLLYCSNKGIVHRDLKPENILLGYHAPGAFAEQIKIADFGFAKRVDGAKACLTTACGTPGYVAPEIISGQPYGKIVDMWSLGVITFILLCGYPPFHDDNQSILFKKIQAGVVEFAHSPWDTVSADAKDFVLRLLTVNPAKRMTPDQALEHTWFTKDGVNNSLAASRDNLKKHLAAKRWKKAIHGVQTARYLSKLLKSHASPADVHVQGL